jgi:hypothetical protein
MVEEPSESDLADSGNGETHFLSLFRVDTSKRQFR